MSAIEKLKQEVLRELEEDIPECLICGAKLNPIYSGEHEIVAYVCTQCAQFWEEEDVFPDEVE